jgi:P pilus assembly chaperone PapD
MKKILMTLTGAIVLLTGTVAHAGVIVGGTRVIYNGENKETTLSVQNKDSSPWVIQSWVDGNGPEGTEKELSRPPFMVTPTLFRLGENTLGTIHISRTGGNPSGDKESVYWLNIKSIPEHIKDKKNTLTVSVNQRVKLFFRPQGLKAPNEFDYRKMTFKKEGKNLVVINPTPYWMTFYSLKISNQSVKTENVMVPPAGKASYTLPVNISGENVNWQIINDYGGQTQVITSLLH